MSSDPVLSQLVCCLAIDQHFIRDPLTLERCGHSFCSGTYLFYKHLKLLIEFE